MNEVDMLQRLESHHRAIETGLAGISRHCGAATRDSQALEDERSRLTAASVARSRFVSEVVAPTLLSGADDALRTELSELLFVTVAKRMVSNSHIARWTAAAIAADWTGYCAAHREIRKMMEAQMEFERCVLIARLKMTVSTRGLLTRGMDDAGATPRDDADGPQPTS